jgi:predicted DNA-binding transcriptional regulator AlpA
MRRRHLEALLELQSRPDDTDTIDRHEAARMLGVTIRTLQRWHRQGYGPPRKRWLGRGVGYSRAEVEQWIAEHHWNAG